MQPALSETQLDAMRELANIGSGTAATALSSLIGLPVELDVPRALVLSVADAVDQAGPRDAILTAIAIPAVGDLDALALILMPAPTVETLCRLLGVDAEAEIGVSALCEIGNVLGSSYLGALSAMTRLQLQPGLPERVHDMLGAILQSALHRQLRRGHRTAARVQAQRRRAAMRPGVPLHSISERRGRHAHPLGRRFVTGEISVRIGGLAVSEPDGAMLLSVGLGSCIGLVLLDAARGLAGLAHIMLPAGPVGAAGAPAKYADQRGARARRGPRAPRRRSPSAGGGARRRGVHVLVLVRREHGRRRAQRRGRPRGARGGRDPGAREPRPAATSGGRCACSPATASSRCARRAPRCGSCIGRAASGRGDRPVRHGPSTPHGSDTTAPVPPTPCDEPETICTEVERSARWRRSSSLTTRCSCARW